MKHYLIRYHSPRGAAWTFIAAADFGAAWAKAIDMFGADAYSVELWADNS